jgi:CRP-like cAMP-binding protein
MPPFEFNAMPNRNEINENLLLAALAEDCLDRLLPDLIPVVMPPGEILYNFNEDLTDVYFPGRSTVVSLLCTTDEHEDVEVGLCGNEGAVGIAGLFGVDISSHQNLVQVPGSGFRLGMSAARKEFRRGECFQELLLKFEHSLFIQVSQTALCNRIHYDEERLARWLLLSADRIEANQLPLPRELLAKLLGLSPARASLTARLLESAGMIRYKGEQLIISDRENLEGTTCSCYWVARRQSQKVLEPSKLNL